MKLSFLRMNAHHRTEVLLCDSTAVSGKCSFFLRSQIYLQPETRCSAFSLRTLVCVGFAPSAEWRWIIFANNLFDWCLSFKAVFVQVWLSTTHSPPLPRRNSLFLKCGAATSGPCTVPSAWSDTAPPQPRSPARSACGRSKVMSKSSRSTHPLQGWGPPNVHVQLLHRIFSITWRIGPSVFKGSPRATSLWIFKELLPSSKICNRYWKMQ